ncbi:hypothetical protein NMYAN_170010 [Nitrosomonas nitrosa]|uniref:Uncharacterized protein n=1 Tax=Nitrosomonas nitrosa TaxID=52442 RepID=A0A8H9D8H1_9PROT|nr:hypothetical protein NMYAN_170010 [Nitrosomonas nitrosa]
MANSWLEWDRLTLKFYLMPTLSLTLDNIEEGYACKYG